MNKKILTIIFSIVLVGIAVALSLTLSTQSLIEKSDLNVANIDTQNKTQLRYPSNYIIYDEELKNYKSENQNVQLIFSKCGVDSHCAADSMIVLSKNETKQNTMNAFNEVISTFDKSGMRCHKQSHHLGEFLYGYTGNLTESLMIADRKCGGGLYHGIIENYFQTELFFDRGNKDTIPVKETCEILKSKPYSHMMRDCTHGTGHGLLRVYDFDLFSAVKRCDEFYTSVDQSACYRGVFMENLVEQWDGGNGTFNQDDLFYPCNSVDEKYAKDCYHYQAQYILDKKKYVVEDSFAECSKIDSETNERHCYYGLGVQIYFAFEYDNPSLISTCQKGNPEYATFCLQGAVFKMVEKGEIEEGFSFCKLLDIPFKEDCYDTIGKWVNSMESASPQTENWCSKAETLEYAEVCNNANPEDLESL